MQPSPRPAPDEESTHKNKPQSPWFSRLAESPDFDLAICLALILSIFIAYARVAHFDFTEIDDPQLISANAHVRGGLTVDAIKWAFTNVVISNWMPVTVLSHMLDCELFGVASGRHHLMNVLLHAISAVMLFMVLRRATGAPWPSAFVSFVFALHPLHVESVAWIAERKDVLSTLFWFLALYAYVYYAERPSLRRYLGVVALFCLGLMSKPMLVTFPFTLLLFDLWPLRRFEWPRILWEKLPMFALSAALSAVTYLVQGSSGAFMLHVPLVTRLENAIEAYLIYIVQMFWPVRLTEIYLFPKILSLAPALAALAIVLCVSALVIAAVRRRPYFAVGWFWYLGTLVPVIGLIQVGFQSHADRYTYVPLVGLSIMLAWGVADVAARWPSLKVGIGLAAVLSCVVCMVLTFRQAAYWRNTETLFQHAVEVTSDNWMAEAFLGGYLMKQPGRASEALDHLEAAVRINPDFGDAHNNLGLCLLNAGLYDAAMPHFETAARLKPGDDAPLNNMGLCFMMKGDYAAAIPYLTAAMHAKPDAAQTRVNLGIALSRVQGRESEAISNLEKAIRLRPDSANARYELGLLYAKAGRTRDAIAQLEDAQRIRQAPEVSQALEKLRSQPQ